MTGGTVPTKIAPTGEDVSRPQLARLFAGLFLIYALFQWSALTLGSDRGQAGLVVGTLVAGATLALERGWFRPTLRSAAQGIGLGLPRLAGLVLSIALGTLLLLVVPLFVGVTGTSVDVEAGAVWLLPGLFAQAGIAEEVLFRGYLFGQLRRGRSFRQAAVLSMWPFVAAHLLLFFAMPWPVALAALFLAVVLSFPLARLYELGGATIWAPALLHTVVQGTVKILVVAGDGASLFPLVWMASSAVLPMFVLLLPPPDRDPGSPAGYDAWP